MKNKLTQYLEEKHWASGRDQEIIKDFINIFFDDKDKEGIFTTCTFCDNLVYSNNGKLAQTPVCDSKYRKLLDISKNSSKSSNM